MILIIGCIIVLLCAACVVVWIEWDDRKFKNTLKKDAESERESRDLHEKQMLILGALSLNKAGLLRPGDVSKMFDRYDTYEDDDEKPKRTLEAADGETLEIIDDEKQKRGSR